MKRSSLSRKKTLSRNSSLKRKGFLKKTALKKVSDETKEKWEEVRQKCLKRDNNVCVVCGAPAEEVHHIHLRSSRKDLVFRLSNLVCLCKLHHFHLGSERYDEQTLLLANCFGTSVDNLLRIAEGKQDDGI